MVMAMRRVERRNQDGHIKVLVRTDVKKVAEGIIGNSRIVRMWHLKDDEALYLIQEREFLHKPMRAKLYFQFGSSGFVPFAVEIFEEKKVAVLEG